MWDVASSHHTVMLNATADAAVDRSVRTDHPVFVARNDRSRSSPKSRTARQSAACGVLSRTGPTGDLLWQITPRNTAYFELTVCPPTDAIPAREPQSECVAIGFVNRSFALQGRQPGWDPSTWYETRPLRNYTILHPLSVHLPVIDMGAGDITPTMDDSMQAPAPALTSARLSQSETQSVAACFNVQTTIICASSSQRMECCSVALQQTSRQSVVAAHPVVRMVLVSCLRV